MSAKKTIRRILITSGDPDGIGSEVCAKALEKIGPQTGFQFVLWRSPHCPLGHLKRIDRRFSRVTIAGLKDLPACEKTSKTLIDIQSDQAPGYWVEHSAKLCLSGHASALVTAPLSKTGLAAAGFKDVGHTEILKRICRRPDLFMAFLGSKFNVVLTTDHRPLREVSRMLNETLLRQVIDRSLHLRKLLKLKTPIGVLGLNPHAGESDLLGTEESSWMPFLKNYKKTELVGPLVPDAAFLKQNWRKYSLFVCAYHDQGLIPFKMIHGFDEGVHLTLGLPFVRTSVDHGTAKELFGLEKAKPGSMIAALQTALQLTKRGTWK